MKIGLESINNDNVSLLTLMPEDKDLIKQYANLFVELDAQLHDRTKTFDPIDKYINKRFNISDLTPEQELTNVVNDQLVIFIMYNKKPVGYFRISGFDKKSTYQHVWGISVFVIDETYSGRGIGTKALELLFELVKRSTVKVKALTLGCLSNNKTALRVYEKVGFKEFSKYLVKEF